MIQRKRLAIYAGSRQPILNRAKYAVLAKKEPPSILVRGMAREVIRKLPSDAKSSMYSNIPKSVPNGVRTTFKQGLQHQSQDKRLNLYEKVIKLYRSIKDGKVEIGFTIKTILSILWTLILYVFEAVVFRLSLTFLIMSVTTAPTVIGFLLFAALTLGSWFRLFHLAVDRIIPKSSAIVKISEQLEQEGLTGKERKALLKEKDAQLARETADIAFGWIKASAWRRVLTSYMMKSGQTTF